MKGLHEFKLLIESLRLTNSRNEKQEILRHVSDEVETLGLLKIILNTQKKFYVTKESILKYEKEQELVPGSNVCGTIGELSTMLESLANRTTSGHAALNWCLATIARNSTGDICDNRDILLNIFDKDLKIGIGATDINKVWKNFVPKHHIRKAYSTTEPKNPGLRQRYLDEINQEQEKWGGQRKLDGLRLTTEVVEGTATTKSSGGNVFTSLSKVSAAVLEMFEKCDHLDKTKEWVFDGEVCVIDEDGNEDFKEAVSQVKRKSVQMENPKYVLFDILTLEEFLARKSKDRYSVRYERIQKCMQHTTSEHLDIIDYWQYTPEKYEEMFQTAVANNWEGLMLVKDTPYAGKKSKDILKVKLFEREEFVVESINIDMMNFNDPVTSIRRPEESFRSINVPVTVDGVLGKATCGTGFSQDMCRHFYKHPEEIIGKTVTLQFQGYSEDSKTGLPSLRIPSLVKIWDEGRDV